MPDCCHTAKEKPAMPIQLVCPSCQFAFSVKDGFQGLTVLCRKCQQKIKVPTGGQGFDQGIANLPEEKPTAGPLPSWLEAEPIPQPPTPGIVVSGRVARTSR